jgi:glycosyltransferase involved in cell wall biosynthesis
MKVGIIGIRGLPAVYGAFDQFVDQFVKFCEKDDIKFYISSCRFFNIRIKNVFQFFTPQFDNFFRIVGYFYSIVTMYLLGVRTFIFFGYGASIFFKILSILNCRIICNVDGIEWRRPNNFLKKKYFKLCEYLVSKNYVNIICDSVVIQRYYSYHYKIKSNLIAYPGFNSNEIFIKKSATKVIIKKNYEKFVVLGRLLEENNIEMIVDAFLKVYKENQSNKKLYIIGRENFFFNKLFLNKIKSSKNIFYLGCIYDRKKLLKLLSSSDFYIHGHSAGGTNPTLIEAISIGLPIISYKCSFNYSVLKKESLYFKSSEDLSNILVEKKDISSIKLSDQYSGNYINNSYLNLLYKL